LPSLYFQGELVGWPISTLFIPSPKRYREVFVINPAGFVTDKAG